MKHRRHYPTLAAGIGIAVLGLVCLGSGIALLAWRLLAPEDAVLLPPGSFEPTPTPGLLGTPLLPPPPPDDPLQIVILPVSERHTPTPHPTATATIPAAISSTSTAPRDEPHTKTATNPAASNTPGRTRIPSSPVTPRPTHSIIAPTQAGTVQSTKTPVPVTVAPLVAPAIPDRIVVDSIGLNAPVVPVGQHPIRLDDRVYSQWDVPDTFAAGWHQSSAPLGRPGNTVINGHHNTSGEVFRYLVMLKPGNIITLASNGRRHHYVVAQTMTLEEQGQPIETREANAQWVLPTHDERVTLITCWPYSASTHRLVVIALPLDDVMPPADIP